MTAVGVPVARRHALEDRLVLDELSRRAPHGGVGVGGGGAGDYLLADYSPDCRLADDGVLVADCYFFQDSLVGEMSDRLAPGDGVLFPGRDAREQVLVVGRLEGREAGGGVGALRCQSGEYFLVPDSSYGRAADFGVRVGARHA